MVTKEELVEQALRARQNSIGTKQLASTKAPASHVAMLEAQVINWKANGRTGNQVVGHLDSFNKSSGLKIPLDTLMKSLDGDAVVKCGVQYELFIAQCVETIRPLCESADKALGVAAQAQQTKVKSAREILQRKMQEAVSRLDGAKGPELAAVKKELADINTAINNLQEP